MATATHTGWAEHALARIGEAGHRASAQRAEVVSALAELGCGVTAREISDLLRARGSRIGLASVYRTLDLLDRMALVQRFEVGEGSARFEPAHPGGEHHHHLVCATCGEVTAFEDDELERAIRRVSRRVDFAIYHHDVTLRGECPACAGR